MTDLNEKLNADKNSIGDYIDDFKKSDAPQFKGKGKSKRRSMAVAAYLASKRKKESHNEGKEHSWKTDGHYTQDGKEWKGPQHAHDGQVMTGEKHTEKSVNLFHFKDLKPNIRQKILDKLKEDAEYDPTPGGMEWGTDKGTEYFKKLTPGEEKAKKTELIKPINTPIQVKENCGCEDIEVETEKDNSKHEYRKQNEAEADTLTDEDIKSLEAEAENFTWEDALSLHLYDDDELEDITDYHSDINITEVLSVQGRLKRRFSARRNRQKLKVARQIALRRGSSPERLKKRAVRGARGMVYKRLLRGRNRANLPPAERSRLETMVKRFAPLVSRLAVKMLPNMRKMEIARMKSRGSKKAQVSKKYKPAKPIKSSSQKSKKAKIPKPKKPKKVKSYGKVGIG